MSVIGIEKLEFGVDDVAHSAKFMADFGLKATVSAVVYLHDEQGNAVPMGSRVAIKGMAGYQMVGREGGVWLENPPLPADITVFMGRESCHLKLPPIAGKQYMQYGVKICSPR